MPWSFKASTTPTLVATIYTLPAEFILLLLWKLTIAVRLQVNEIQDLFFPCQFHSLYMAHTSMKSFHKLSCCLLKKLLLFHCWWFEGTGRSLSLKLLHQLELQSSMSSTSTEGTGSGYLLIVSVIYTMLIRILFFPITKIVNCFCSELWPYVVSHYKNSPNDLKLMVDATAHHFFCITWTC
ncbi:RNA cytidine acetyltransferase-like isoform X2 [Cajanus cajan]|uniref:RNA cytidine acetyltransferase-like isoform X2 n=1 Tax=Cajanus cajan TaxID=3821 RepID=UPI0010FB19EE|nr:RNA cytidine acetyltransferase-like isoform X2 [Cajanus cajan]